MHISLAFQFLPQRRLDSGFSIKLPQIEQELSQSRQRELQYYACFRPLAILHLSDNTITLVELRFTLSILLLVMALHGDRVQCQPVLYWTTNYKIQRLDMTRSVVEDVVTDPLADPARMALDAERGHLYWWSSGTNNTLRSTIDGTDIRILSPGRLIALDKGRQKVYVISDSTLQQMNLDGSDAQPLFTISNPYGFVGGQPVAIDPDSGTVYWPTLDDKIYRANLDGSGQELFFDLGESGIGYIKDLLIDAAGGFLYALDGGFGPHIATRVNLDGSGYVRVRDHEWVRSIAVDRNAGKVYWAESTDPPSIRRSNLDGSDLEELTLVHSHPSGIALDADRDLLMWNSPYGMWRSRLDGSEVEQVVVSNLYRPHGLRIDHSGEKVYWTNWRAIGRHDSNGLHEEMLVDVGSGIEDIALDANAGFLYWVLTDEPNTCRWGGTSCEAGSGRIQRSRLDGSDVEDVVSLAHQPWALDIDAGGEQLYWASSEGIFTVRPDGSEMTKLTSFGVFDIRIDPGRERIYWLAHTLERGHELGWTRMDGAVTEIQQKGGTALAVDSQNGYVYWYESDQPETISGGTIWRSQSTGAGEKQHVVSVTGDITSLAIDAEGRSTDGGVTRMPLRFELEQNFPNPFNHETAIRFAVPDAMHVRLEVFDVLGHQVATLMDRQLSSGTQSVLWDGRNDDGTPMPTGLYLYRIIAGDHAANKTMVMVR